MIKLFRAMFLLALLTVPITAACNEEESQPSEGTPTATATDVLLVPIK